MEIVHKNLQSIMEQMRPCFLCWCAVFMSVCCVFESHICKFYLIKSLRMIIQVLICSTSSEQYQSEVHAQQRHDGLVFVHIYSRSHSCFSRTSTEPQSDNSEVGSRLLVYETPLLANPSIVSRFADHTTSGQWMRRMSSDMEKKKRI